MPNLEDNVAFAVSYRHNLTEPMTHVQVVELANVWLPKIHFHEREQFHPIDLGTLFSAPTALFAALPEPAKDEFRVTLFDERFDPPTIHSTRNDVRRVLGSGAEANEALHGGSIDSNSAYSHGHNLRSSRQFFGATATLAGGTEPVPGDPRRPRHLPIVVRAEMRMLLNVLKHELELDNSDNPAGVGLPIDAIWSGFAMEDSFFNQLSSDRAHFPRLLKRKFSLLSSRTTKMKQSLQVRNSMRLESCHPDGSFSQRPGTL